MTVKLNSFSNSNLSLDHAKICADTLASIVNDILETEQKMCDSNFDTAKCQELGENAFWKIYNYISFIETDKNIHPKNYANRD
jgi:hypothetical protein|tara:strand:+ start:832 stop:1080 length:249 start_codon:yes stop_codon:yes gene_type:complete